MTKALMTGGLRLRKLGELEQVCKYVNRADDGLRLCWPHPLGQQYAMFNSQTGGIERFHKISGEEGKDTELEGSDYPRLIDRRINYLHDRYRKEIRQLKEQV